MDERWRKTKDEHRRGMLYYTLSGQITQFVFLTNAAWAAISSKFHGPPTRPPPPLSTNRKRHEPILTAVKALQLREFCDKLMPCECLPSSLHLTKL